jgi:hypothetical protein
MATDMLPSTPTASRAFHTPELWVLLRTLGVFAPGVALPPELAPATVQAAEASLRQERALLSDAAGRLTLAPAIEALLRPAAYPETVFIASVTNQTQSEPVERQACFSWTPQAFVVNWVDDSQAHHFEAYQPQAVQNNLWDHLSRLCSLDVDEPDPAAAMLTSQAIEQGVEGMSQAVLLMAINRLQAPDQAAQALSWWVSGRSAWIMQKEPQSGPVMLTPAGRAGLQMAVMEFVKQALRSA